MRAAKSRKEETRVMRMTMAMSSYRTGNQIKLPKHRLNIGQMTVGIQVSKLKKATTAMQMVEFHFPRGANRSDLKALIAVSIPNTRVMYPIKNMATAVSSNQRKTCRRQRTRKRHHGQSSTIIRKITTKRSALHCYKKNLLYYRASSQYKWERFGRMHVRKSVESTTQGQRESHSRPFISVLSTYRFFSGT